MVLPNESLVLLDQNLGLRIPPSNLGIFSFYAFSVDDIITIILISCCRVVTLCWSSTGEKLTPTVVTMPTVPFHDLAAFVSQAHTTMQHRFHQLEPAIYRKGKLTI